MEERQLEAQQSFDLINRMIENTRQRMERNAGRPFLVWGYTTILFSLLVWSLVFYSNDMRWNWLWFAMPVVGSIAMYLTRQKSPEGKIRTFVDRVINHIWTVIGVAAWFLATLSMFGVVRPPMIFLIVLMMGIGTAITSLVIRFTPGIVGGFVGIVLAPALLTEPATWQIWAFVVAFVAMMIVPGHILNYRSNHSKRSLDV